MDSGDVGDGPEAGDPETGGISHAYFMRVRAQDRAQAEREEEVLTDRVEAVEVRMAGIVETMASFNRWSVTILGGLTLSIAGYLGLLITNNNAVATDNRVHIAETAVVVKDLSSLVKEITATTDKRFDGVDQDLRLGYEKLDAATVRHRATHDADHRNGH